MTSKTWKSAERTIAKLLGGERVPITGRTRGSAPDISHETLGIEVKHWQSFPNWMRDAMEQAEKSVRGEQIPTVILHEKGTKYEECLTIMRLRDTIRLLKKIEELESEVERFKDALYYSELGQNG